MTEESKAEGRSDTTLGARQLVLDTAMRALIEQANATDPTLGDRILIAVDAYILSLDPQSPLERDFADRAKSYAAAIVRPLPR